MLALCFEHSPVWWEVRLSQVVCSLVLPWGGGRWREPFVFIGAVRFYFTQYIEDSRESVSFPGLGKVCYNITSLHVETVCDAVCLLLGVPSWVF